MSGNEWPWWWRVPHRVLHRLIRWLPAEPYDEINEQRQRAVYDANGNRVLTWQERARDD